MKYFKTKMNVGSLSFFPKQL